MADAGADQYTFHLEATGKSNSAPHCGLWHTWGLIKGVIFVSTGYSSANIQLICAKQSGKSQQPFCYNTLGTWLHVRTSCKLFLPAEVSPQNKDLV